MKLLTSILLFITAGPSAMCAAREGGQTGVASWYGRELSGNLMANGQPFNPDSNTCASWFYPLGTVLCVSRQTPLTTRRVIVTVTDRGPAWRLVRQGRIIDLSHAAFAVLEDPRCGLVTVRVERVGK